MIAYFDCFSGIAGDMILGALVDAGLDFEFLKQELQKLNLSGYTITSKKVMKGPIAATKIDVDVTEKQPHRYLKDINEIIDKSTLKQSIKEKSRLVFSELGKHEANVHGTTPDKIHFHEIGAVDSILDIVGSIIGFDALNIDKIYCSQFRLGTGFMVCAHGKIPIPVPAVTEICSGVPIELTENPGFLVTPSGAILMKTFASFEKPEMILKRTGYGAGTADFEHPNVLRLMIGEKKTKSDEAIVIETNIDDMNPELYDYVIEKLLENSAKDVWLENIQMKKNRPGTKFCVLCERHDLDRFADIILKETTSNGIRYYPVSRRKLKYEITTVETEYGPVRCKKAGDRIKPEYEDCKRIAREKGISIMQVYGAVDNSFK